MKAERHAVSERLTFWGERIGTRERRRDQETAGPDGRGSRQAAAFNFEAELAKATLEAQTREQVGSVKSRKEPEAKDKEGLDTASGDTKLEIMRLIIEKLSGKRVHIYSADADIEESDAEHSEPVQGARSEGTGEMPRRGFGLEYEYRETHVESESTAFAAEGVVRTADGRELAFDVSLEMSRERVDITSFSLRAGDPKPVDPLVINFSGRAAELTESKIEFDLDRDGQAEQVSFVRAGSGFLVLDRNRDGVVNDGGELFGPATGDGFRELAQYDDDSNGWIDEADAVSDNLAIWTKDENNRDTLSGLMEKDVGAIYLGRVATPFELKGEDDTLQGQVQSTGVYLEETGLAGTIQQVDLVT
jgi:hypothetical protein